MSKEERDKRIVIWTDLDTRMDWIRIKEGLEFKNYHELVKDMLEVYKRNKNEIRFTETE